MTIKIMHLYFIIITSTVYLVIEVLSALLSGTTKHMNNQVPDLMFGADVDNQGYLQPCAAGAGHRSHRQYWAPDTRTSRHPRQPESCFSIPGPPQQITASTNTWCHGCNDSTYCHLRPPAQYPHVHGSFDYANMPMPNLAPWSGDLHESRGLISPPEERGSAPRSTKSEPANEPPPSSSRRKPGRPRKEVVTENSGEDGTGRRGGGSRADEEAARARVREKNRIAADRCRDRQRKVTQDLRTKCERLEDDNNQLRQTLADLRTEKYVLKSNLAQHGGCGDEMITSYLGKAMEEWLNSGSRAGND